MQKAKQGYSYRITANAKDVNGNALQAVVVGEKTEAGWTAKSTDGKTEFFIGKSKHFDAGEKGGYIIELKDRTIDEQIAGQKNAIKFKELQALRQINAMTDAAAAIREYNRTFMPAEL